MPSELWTIGHSTRSSRELVDLLQAHAIRTLVDIRAFPSSRRNPQFNSATIAQTLLSEGLSYHLMSTLGGRRKSRPDSFNVGWRNPGFRGYADYMQTESFQVGLRALTMLAEESRVAIMCAEVVPWRCHRSLIADALVCQGFQVRHIVSATKAELHSVTPFAQLKDGRLSYPEPPASQSSLRLF